MKNMVLVNGGVFVRGCGPGQDNTLCETDEKPAHQVRISDFYMGKYEVTQREWQEIMGDEFAIRHNVGCGNCPVELVSWDDIQIFLSRLNARTGKVFRLPTEAEWEYAARGGAKSVGYRYSGSNDLNEVAWWTGNTENTRPVGMKKPNELGLYDMSGNVREWCQDWYQFDIYKAYSQSPEMPFNPKGPDQANRRVIRGGGWGLDSEKDYRVSFRKNQTASVQTSLVGFRLVRDL
jgi:formylglycine-generating enzyme required for sulfatase activity